MTSPRPRHALPRVLPLVLLALAIPLAAFGQPPAPGTSELAPEVRERLSQAAADTLLPPWQRDMMQRLARTGAAAALDSPAADSGAAQPALAPGNAVGAWAVPSPPSARYCQSAIYDPVRDRMVVFAGSGASGYLNDVWTLSLAGTPAWTLLTPTGAPPSARGNASAIYDPVRDRMVVFGGYAGSSPFNDVWALSLAGPPAWTHLTPTGTPPSARYYHSAIYDPVRDRMVVFGGSQGYASFFNDVWALSLVGPLAWTQLTPTGTTPSARYGHSAIYDPVRDRMVVFGGLGPGYLNDVWGMSLAGTSAWTQLTTTGTPPFGRYGHSAIYDPVRDRMVVFEGYGTTALSDVEALSLAGTPAWTQVMPTGAPPTPRYYHSAIYDPVRDRTVVFGGYTGSTYLNDAWGLLLAGTPAWTPLSTPPSARSGHSAIYDPVRDRMVVFGGYPPYYLDEVWALSLAGAPAWTRLTPTGAPPAGRWGHSAIYDPVRDRMVIFGGYGGSYLGDSWALSLAGTPAWTQLTPTGTPPSARYGHSTIYDPVRDRVVIFGGVSSGYGLNDVWALSLAGTPVWTQLTPIGTPPSARELLAAIYDPVRDRMVLFGGWSSGDLNDVWVMPLAGTAAWTQLTPSGPPPNTRYGHSAIYDPVRDRMVVFGGQGWGGTGFYYFNDVCVLSLTGTPAWAKLTPNGTTPNARNGHSAIYDPVRDGMVVFGGGGAAGYNDVCILTWGAPALAGVTCPGDLVWTPGGSLAASYSITNPNGFAQTADYTLTSARNWPGFPVSGSVAVGANGTVTVPISAPVPDSAAGGWSSLTFGATLRGVPQYAACTHNLVDEATPVALSLVSAQAEPGRVRLTWYAAGGVGSVATVYRSVVSGPWSAVGQVAADGSGQILYEDRAVTPGARYGYRLGVMDQGREVFAGETWVEVPLTAELALGGVRPNPATQELAVTFSLPDASPARLEAFDLAGRRVAAREVGRLGGGSHEVRLGEGRPLAPGIYLLRLTRGARVLKARAVIVR